jgi:hypothetical protein
MGVLTDLVVVDVSKAGDVAESRNPAEEFQGIDIKGIDPVKLCELKAVLIGQPYDKAWNRDFEFVAGDKEEGPWLISFPNDLAAAIGGIAEDQVESTAEAWIGSGAFELDNWNTMDVIDVLWSMRGLLSAKRAPSEAAFLWMSL